MNIKELNIDLSNAGESDQRLGELMLFIAKRCEDDPCFGATKLNKIIFFADFFAFRRTGKSITGCDFMRLPQGPAPRRLLPVRNRLMEDGRAILRDVALWSGHTQQRLTPLSEPDISQFSARDIAIVTSVIEHLWKKNAEEVSGLSHELPAWQLADDGETIPLESAFIMSLKASEAEVATGLSLMENHGW